MSTLPVATSRAAPDTPEARRLATGLREVVRGDVRFDAGSRALYATDASNYRRVPIGVVFPRDSEDVEETLRLCREHGAPVLGRGGGTSLAGQCCNVAVVLDFSRYMHQVLEVDPERRIARVQPGCVLDDLRAAAGEYGLTFGPDPATHTHCTLGGMIGNNSCGAHSVMAATQGPGPRTEHNVQSLVVLTADGDVLKVGRTSDAVLQRVLRGGGRRAEIYRRLHELGETHGPAIRAAFPDIPRRVSGYNLPELLPESGFDLARALVGTEGTCALFLEATVTLIQAPRHRALLVAAFEDVYQAGDHVAPLMDSGPIALEGIDRQLIGFMRAKGAHAKDLELIPEGGGFLLVEFGGATLAEASDRAGRAADTLRRHTPVREVRLYDDPDRQRRVWAIRESGLGATAWIPGRRPTWPGWEDAAVPPDRVGAYLREFRRLLDRFRYDCALYGHFGQGCIHTRIDFELRSAEGVRRFLSFLDEAADLVVGYGGSLSGEHGDGQARAALLARMYPPEIMAAFHQFKAIWDPSNRMNPGRIIDAPGPDQHLRLGPGFQPRTVATRFAFQRDLGSFQQATLRCVGVGKCRRHEGGVMCPSYRATGQEMHSTRGRARLLFEMMQGEVISDGWRSKEVAEALDLCLACKGCRTECPVGVDMATYKAEFLSHHYEGRVRPRTFYALGLIHWWARAASLAPGFVNWVTGSPLAGLLKVAAGVAGDRELPRLAPETFRTWFRRRDGRRAPNVSPRGRVVLWPDTFTDHFHPATGRAATRVLEAAGFEVTVPGRDVCCGRPLYDWGALDLARRLLRSTVDVLAPELRAGTVVVGLEPSCLSVFRDELPGMLPEDDDARLLAAQSYTLSEFLERFAGHLELPKLGRKALLHGHCHDKTVLDFDAEQRVLAKMDVSCTVPEAGCCGMAGAFGFEAPKADVSRTIARRALAPAVRNADGDTLIVADGFSCREQIRQETGKEAVHLARIIDLGLSPPAAAPKSTASAITEPAPPRRNRSLAWLALGAGVVFGAALAGALLRGRSRGRVDVA